MLLKEKNGIEDCVNAMYNYLNDKEKTEIYLENLIKKDFKNDTANFFATEPSIFKEVINKFMDEKKYDLIYDLFVICKDISEKPDFVFVSTSQNYTKNRKHLFLINSAAEKNKITESLSELPLKKTAIKRL